MLTTVEKMLFFMLALVAIGATYSGFMEMWLVINRGQGKLYLDKLPLRLLRDLQVYLAQTTTLTKLGHLGDVAVLGVIATRSRVRV